jgi:hypothetical protein
MKTILLILLLLTSINLKADGFEYGFNPSISNYSLIDNLDNNISSFVISPFNLTATTKSTFSRYSNWVFDLGHNSIKISADQDAVGKSIASWFFMTSYESRYVINRDLSIYLGGGLGLSQNMVKGIHTIDKDGYLLNKYDDEDSTTYFTNLHATYYSKISNYKVGYKIFYKYDPEFTSGFGISFVFLFK